MRKHIYIGRYFVVLNAVFAAIMFCSLAGPSVTSGFAQDAIEPFNGKNFDGWIFRDPQGPKESVKWVVGRAEIDPNNTTEIKVLPCGEGDCEMVNTGAWLHTDGDLSVDIITEKQFGDCTVDLEFMIPTNANSGIYLMGRYEVQIRDDYGKTETMFQDLGAIYKVSPPSVPTARKPSEWQHYAIEFQAPRFKNGMKVANAKFVKVVLNGKVIQENVWVPGPTGGQLYEAEAPTGPLMFQGNHGSVAFRNIKITVPSNK